jgi:hypothetical protein
VSEDIQTITLRTLFDRATVLKLLEEPELAHNLALRAIRDITPFNDHYLAIFVFSAKPLDDGTLLLRATSTTVVGIRRDTTIRMRHQGIYLTKGATRTILSQTLRAHFRAQQEGINERLASIGSSINPRWTKNFPNGAGDLVSPPEFVMADPDLTELERLFSTPDPRSEIDEAE